MTTTPDLGIPELSQSQATPEITHNEALVMLQALLNGALDKDLTAPPGSPAEGDSYIINTATPTGAWAGQAYKVAIFWGGVWRFVPGVDSTGTTIVMGTRQAGLRIYVRDENKTYTWRGTLWSGTSYTAAEIAFTPTGTIAATDVQAAIAEAASEAVQVGGRTANSVIGRSANSSGAAADIVAGTNDRLLTQVSNALGFTQLTAGMVPANTIALAGLANAGAQYDIVGRKTASGGAWEDCTRTQLQLPGLPDANVFTAVNTFNQNSTAAPGAVSGVTTALQLVAPDSAQTAFIQDGFAGVTRFLGRRANGTNAAKTAVGSGQGMSVLAAVGHDGTNYTNVVAQIVLVSAEAFDPTHNGSEIQFATVSLATTALNTRIHIRDGLYTHNASGGDKGADTVNAIALYEAGVALTAKYAQLGVENNFTAPQHVVSATLAPSGLLNGTAYVAQWNDDGGAGGPFYACFRNSASPAVADGIGGMLGYGKNSSAATFLYWAIVASILTPTAGAEAAGYSFYTSVAGSLASRFFVGAGFYSNGATDLGGNTINVTGVVRPGQFTVSTLSSASSMGIGARALVGDALAPTFGATVVGGGAVAVPVYSDGTNWKVG